MSENLNKENFWNEMYSKYPLAMKEFCKWIDEYKKRVEWNDLFNEDLTENDDHGMVHAPKFHDIPLAMQMGIWEEYVNTRTVDECKQHIETLLHGFEEGINKQPPPITI